MCGISGIIRYGNGSDPTDREISSMMEQIGHRGPNQSGIQLMDRAALGFNRLSIVDIEDGAQPMTNENGQVWLIFNGEIYNYKELRQQLLSKGHQFRNRTDSEIIVHLYEEYGIDCVHHLRGMFSFVIWDRKEQRLFAARDHFGIKPFYYSQEEHQFLFSSELKGLLAVSGQAPHVDYASMMHYLTFQYVPQPQTMFKGIQKLEPGHFMLVDREGRITKRRYWEPAFEPEQRPIGTFIEEIRAVLRDSVKLHRQGDVPLGSFLSGGIDSSAIAALSMQEQLTKTFSVGFAGERNENEYARAAADVIGSKHYEEEITPEQFFANTQKAVWHMDEPVADPSAVALYSLSQLAGKQVTVVMSGEGADELFGGYGIYGEPRSLRPVSWLPDGMKSRLHRMVERVPLAFRGKNYLLRGFSPIEQRFYGNAKLFNEKDKQQITLLNPERFEAMQPSASLTSDVYYNSRHLDDVTRMQLIDMNFWLPGDILMKADKMSMAHSLELRVPFLDKEVFEVARKIPAEYKLANGTTKYVLREAMRGILPEPLVQRPKLGFPIPLRKWLHGKIGDQMLEQISFVPQWFNVHAARLMLMQHREGKGDYSRKLWALYIFAVWHSTFIGQYSFGQARTQQLQIGTNRLHANGIKI
ncbi:asparagine synthase (glutamine-hydrolyzing) [Paenibacillus sp. FSL H8-0537]|uniref:asparagine synthase (glutamine-hydrolyzing) n=1 Tax=Paenibacillus sp. FSL H8-0537 TaxID=2921399 RepID=UPI0031018B0A